jgi:N-methylhydantoinase B
MIDPITFEVLRHRLSTIVEEGAAVLRNVSGSPSVAQSNDCNVALLTADGEGVIIGRTIASHAISCIQTVRHVLKEYPDNPGINPDDMFFSNHPYIGTPHQPCGVMVAPIFAGDRIVAWSGTGIHFGDVGGTVPGQVSIGAKSIWGEAIPVPPIKLVEQGRVRKDLEAEFLTRTRTKVQNAVDLKGMIGGNNTITRRVLAIVRRYGAETLTEALYKVISVSEEKLRAILREIPDGRWSSENYLDYYDDDRMKIYACRLTMTKERESLVFDFTKSSQQAPAVVNATFAATEGYLLRAMLALFGFAVSHCPAAIQRIIRIEATEGTIVHCSWPAGVCKGTTSVTQNVWELATHCLGRMLLGSEKYKERAMAVSRGHLMILDVLGKDQYGAPFAAVFQECCQAAGTAARSASDGIDTGGVPEPEVSIPNVESNEFRYPVLYLFRRQRIDSGGAGKFRGGLGLSMAITPHDVAEISDVMIHTHGVTVPSALGLSGGYPSELNRVAIRRKTDVAALFERGIMPTDLSELEDEEETPPNFVHTRLDAGDILICTGGGGGGYGDALERSPDLVVRDVGRGLISRDAAKTRYGVMLDKEKPVLDSAATSAERSAIRAERQRSARSSDRSPPARQTEADATVASVNEYLSIASGPQGPVVRCRCGFVLCSASDDYRINLSVREISGQAPDIFASGKPVHLPPYVVKEFFCPGCWTIVETDVTMIATEP